MKVNSGYNLLDWCLLPTPLGDFRMYDSGDEMLRLVSRGDIWRLPPKPLIRIHSSCLASEVFSALDCDCADQLREAMKRIALEDGGLVFHLHQEGRGQGLAKKIRAVRLMQTDNLDTFASFEKLGLEQDIRGYECVAEVLRTLDVRSVRLITNNPRKLDYLARAGIAAEMVHTHPAMRDDNRAYLLSKRTKLGHRIPDLEGDDSHRPITFYHSDQTWGWLSNFSPHAVFIKNRIWPTVEHYYQAQKLAGRDEEETIRCALGPMQAKIAARALTLTRTSADWGKRKESVMLEGLAAKFRQHPDLGRRLVATGDRKIVELSDSDHYWGANPDGEGQNRLGVLLMEIRAALQNPHEQRAELR